MPPRWKTKYMMTLATSSATVTIGKRSVGMLSLSGNTRRRLLPGGQGTHAGQRLLDVLVGVVARAHERPGRHVVEAHRHAGLRERVELVGVPVAHHGQVPLRRAQVLP